MINKLLLVRISNAKSNLLDQAGLTRFAKGESLKVSPIAWSEQDPLTHYGYVLSGMKLDDYQSLEEWDSYQEGTTVLDFPEGSTVEGVLKSVGLRIHPAA